MRLIYANEFKKRIDRYSTHIRDIVKKELRCVKTVKAEPVVRCKDCMYNKGEVNKKGFRICSANGMDITDDDYCSWGERMNAEDIDNAPTIEAEPVRHGKWIGTEYDGYADGNPVYYEWICSECKTTIEDDEPIWNYCPCCGARMDKGEEE